MHAWSELDWVCQCRALQSLAELGPGLVWDFSAGAESGKGPQVMRASTRYMQLVGLAYCIGTGWGQQSWG